MTLVLSNATTCHSNESSKKTALGTKLSKNFLFQGFYTRPRQYSALLMSICCKAALTSMQCTPVSQLKKTVCIYGQSAVASLGPTSDPDPV